jgi:hypothetical protein
VQEQERVRATALLLQDDYWHYQATLARALDRSTWWDSSEALEQQATIDDRKTVWAAPPAAKTNDVAAAQGWLDYLNQRRKCQGSGTPSLSAEDVDVMALTFCLLEDGRGALAQLAGRDASHFRESRVLQQLANPQRIVDLIDTGCAELKRTDPVSMTGQRLLDGSGRP